MDKRIIMLWCNRKNTHLKDMNDLGKNYDKKIFIKKDIYKKNFSPSDFFLFSNTANMYYIVKYLRDTKKSFIP